ncbi:MAG: hypothetical protein KBA71_11135 [Opitutaceae bacterium]|nr:hypothetical protein [Opitutaceae bacterium]
MMAFALLIATTINPVTPGAAHVPDSTMATSLLLGASALGLAVFARYIKNRRK